MNHRMLIVLVVSAAVVLSVTLGATLWLQRESLEINPASPPPPLQGRRRFLAITLSVLIVLFYGYWSLRNAAQKVRLRQKFANQVNQQLSHDLQTEIEQQRRSTALRPSEIDVVFAYIVNKYAWSPYGWPPAPKCIAIDKEGGRHYADTNDPDCETAPHVSGSTKVERWNQLHQKLLARGILSSQDQFPDQNARGLDMDYVFIADQPLPSDQSEYYLYWTDPQTGIRWQMDSQGLVTAVK